MAKDKTSKQDPAPAPAADDDAAKAQYQAEREAAHDAEPRTRHAPGDEVPVGDQKWDGEIITQEAVDGVDQARRNANQE